MLEAVARIANSGPETTPTSPTIRGGLLAFVSSSWPRTRSRCARAGADRAHGAGGVGASHVARGPSTEPQVVHRNLAAHIEVMFPE